MLTDLFSLHEQYFEIQEKEFLTSSTYVKGRLTENIGFWETIGANPEILKILREGYRIPFFESPPESFSKNNISALKNMEFVEEAVFELLKSNRVVQTPFKVSKVAKIRNRYNQVPHLTQDTNGKVTNSQKTPQTRAKRSALSQQVTTKHI